MAKANPEFVEAKEGPIAAGPRAVTRLLALFDALSSAPGGLSLADLSVVLESPKSSLLNLLRPLVAEAYLIHGGGMYRLGPFMFRLASAVVGAWYLPTLVRPLMRKLAVQTGESVLLSVLNPDKGLMTYIDIVRSPHPVHYQIAAGTVRPIYPAASGRVLLAFAEPKWRQEYIASLEITVRTAIAITKASLRREVEVIRARGHATAIDVSTTGLSSIAAPLFDVSGHCVACLGIAGPSDRIKLRLETLEQNVRDGAAKASTLLAQAGRTEAASGKRQLRTA